MENRYEVEGNLFESIAYYATKSVEKIDGELQEIRLTKSNKFGDTRVGIAFDYCLKNNDVMLTLVMWPSHYLTPDEEIELDMAIESNAVKEVQYRINTILDPETGKPKEGSKITPKWYAWRDASGVWHRPSGERIAFIDNSNSAEE